MNFKDMIILLDYSDMGLNSAKSFLRFVCFVLISLIMTKQPRIPLLTSSTCADSAWLHKEA